MSGLGDKKSQKDVTNPGNSGPSTRKFRDFATDRESFNYALKQQQGIDPSSSAALESPPNEYNPSYAPEHSTGGYGSSNQIYHSYATEHSTGGYVLREPYVVPCAAVSSIGEYVLRESSASPYAPKSPREQQSKEGALADRKSHV